MVGPWRVLVSDGLAQIGVARLQQEAEVVLDDLASLGSVDGWIVRSRTLVDAAALASAAPRLRVLGRAGVGVDNIDLDTARREKVIVVTAPEATTIAVAEHTLALMLALARHIPAGDAALRRGEWPKGRLEGSELHGKTLGLIGLGRIGRAVGQRAAALGMAVIAHDPYLTPEAIQATGAAPAEMDTLLAASAFVLPLLGAHRSLEAERDRVRQEATLSMESALAKLHQVVERGEYRSAPAVKDAVAALDIELTRLARVPTWPWNPGTLRGVLAAVFLPVFIWLVQYVLQRLLG